MMPQSLSKHAPWDLTEFSQSPSVTLSYFSESYQWSEISSLSTVILVLGKAREIAGHQIWAVEEAKSPGWFDVSPNNSAWAGALSWWSCQSQLLISSAFWIIQIVSVEECSSLTQNLMQICCCTHSVILNVVVIQYTCSYNGVYHWPGPVQWSCHCSHMHIPVHSPWLPGYINVAQTILIISTMAGPFPDRPHI